MSHHEEDHNDDGGRGFGNRTLTHADLDMFMLLTGHAPLQSNTDDPHPDDNRCAEICLRTVPLFFGGRRVRRVNIPKNMVQPRDGAPPQRVPHEAIFFGAPAILARLRTSESFTPFFLLYGGFGEPKEAGGAKVFHWSTVCPYFGNVMILNALTTLNNNGVLHYAHKIITPSQFVDHFLQPDQDQSEFKNKLPLMLVPIAPSP